MSLLALLSAWIGDVSALGLGELRTRSHLGDPLFAEVDVLSAGKEVLDAGCFRLRSPRGDAELPWLRRASFNLRTGAELVLEIRTELPLRDPVLQVGIVVACGHEVQRDYTLLLSPRGKEIDLPVPAATAPAVATTLKRERPVVEGRQPHYPAAGEAPPRPVPRPVERRARPAALPDRLVLSGPGEAVGEPSLRLATELLAWGEGGREAGEAQRELLRLEYRMLAAMSEQATSQLAAAEKLRNMETTLADLQQRASEFADRIERAPAARAEALSSPSAEAAPQTSQTALSSLPKVEPSSAKPALISEWSFYGAILGGLLGIGGWLGWRQYRDRRERLAAIEEPVPEPIADPTRPAEIDEFGEVDFHVGRDDADIPTVVDVPLDAEEVPAPPIAPPVSEATLDEQFEANPVMELAEIMLSFGRVKGAAQALQEYIDHNPEEALQPWIRLMDVYRMAGMREEFDRVAQDLNRHFNVEIQHWAPEPTGSPLDKPLDFVLDAEGDSGEASPQAVQKALTLEDMEHIRNKLTGCWGSTECLGYLNQLLRDNRDGKRSGFTLPVVEEILFLIELLETRNSMEAKNGEKNG